MFHFFLKQQVVTNKQDILRWFLGKESTALEFKEKSWEIIHIIFMHQLFVYYSKC